MKYKCLTIAGFDGSGGAGIQADLKTFSAFGCYGMTVLTAIPVQNTCGVVSCYNLPPTLIHDQLENIFSDIIPDAIKIGMLFSTEIIEIVVNFLQLKAKNIPIILDPVMIAKSNDPLLQPEAIHTLKTKLIPLAKIITPNVDEAFNLIGYVENDFDKLALELLKLSPEAVFLKGGHSKNSSFSNDLYVDQHGFKQYFESKRILTKNTHGTGCSLSSAICAAYALGYSSVQACKIGKYYIYEAIKSAATQSIGKGYGPINHLYHLESTINNFIIKLNSDN